MSTRRWLDPTIRQRRFDRAKARAHVRSLLAKQAWMERLSDFISGRKLHPRFTRLKSISGVTYWRYRWPGVSQYAPHQGPREMERRRRQLGLEPCHE